MSVYLDSAGHLTADADDELHVFAQRLGLRREWFQDHRHRHYDVMSATKRVRALRMGAYWITPRETVRRQIASRS